MSALARSGMHDDGALGVLRVAGADARAFLQGQLSNDLLQLRTDNSLLAAFNTPQGRVIAVLRLFERADGLHALLPQALIPATIERLRRYVLRSKAALAAAEDLSVAPLVGSAADALARDQPNAVAPASPGAQTPATTHSQSGDVSLLTFADATPRALLVGPAPVIDDLLRTRRVTAASWNDWQGAQIAAGEPQVHAQTSEHFVAQMLNLDLVGGLSFTKGCYTGQEIIVRTQHLGRIKRRMVRFAARATAPTPGDRLLANGEPVGEVVAGAMLPDHRCEFLAVVSLAQLDAPLTLGGGEAVERLRLPYTIGDER